MIVGYVRDRLPRVSLPLPGLEGTVHVEFILDTGFDGELCLPTHLLDGLDAAYVNTNQVRLADGSRREQDYFRLYMDWFGEEREIEVIATRGLPLLGNQLLEGCSINIDMRDGGEVTIEF